jgi:serine protease Do
MKWVISTIVLIAVFSGCTPKGIAPQVKKIRNSVVHIENVKKCQGSGFIATSDGIIVTAKHVVEGGTEFITTLDNGKKYRTTRVLQSKDHDVAFLKVDTDDTLVTAPIGTFSTVDPGDPIFIFGSPFGFDNFNSVSLGIVSARQRNLDDPTPCGYGWTVTFQSDAVAEPGNSGGPVFNIHGQVIGVLVAVKDAGVNYSVAVDVFNKDISLIRNLFDLNRYQVPDLPKVEEEYPVYSCH